MTYHPGEESIPLRERVRNFFFAEEVPYGMAIIRIALSLQLLGLIIQHWPYVRILYSTDGAPAPLWENFFHPNLLPLFSPTMAVAGYALLTVALITSCLGWHTRLSLAVTTVLFFYFSTVDSISTTTKFTVISLHAFLLLTVSRCGDVWSVDAWLKRKSAPVAWPGVPDHPRSPVWPQRLLAILIGVVYLGAAVTKMHTPGYFSGDQMAHWMLTNLNFANPVGEWLSLYPGMLVVSSYVVILWEIMFLCLCWSPRTRWIAVSLGFVFHLMTGLLLGLLLFPIICMTIYLSLYSQADFQRNGKKIRRWARQSTVVNKAVSLVRRIQAWEPPRLSPSASLSALGVAAAVAVLLSVEIEYRMDIYGERRPEGPYVLEPMSQDRVRTLLTEAGGIESVDKVFAFDIGTRLLGDVLMDRRHSFSPGENAIVQCSLQPAHEDLFVEVHLRDADDHIVQRSGTVVPRENLRGNLHYHLDGSLPEGDYSFVLRVDGKEVARRRFQLKG